MAPKNNAKGGDKAKPAKGKGKDAGDDAGKGKLKAATAINARHILVRFSIFLRLD
jgi:NIMA-interacting peptidyl-prolyl cis-trans isomerase 4